jgi:hypothetical protein
MSGREVTFQAMLRAIATNRMDLIALRPCQILIRLFNGREEYSLSSAELYSVCSPTCSFDGAVDKAW